MFKSFVIISVLMYRSRKIFIFGKIWDLYSKKSRAKPQNEGVMIKFVNLIFRLNYIQNIIVRKFLNIVYLYINQLFT